MTSPDAPEYTDFEKGERQALLEVRSFLMKHGTAEVDAFCAQRLHDIAMDARPKVCMQSLHKSARRARRTTKSPPRH